MKPEIAIELKEEIVEVHSSGRSPSPKHKGTKTSRSRSRSRKMSNGHGSADGCAKDADSTSEKSKRDSWINSEQNESVELPIHDQIKQGILGFVEKEFKHCDATGQSPSFVFYSHDPTGLDDKYLKSLSRPSSGYKEKRSPSYRRKKSHSSRHRERELQEFEVPGSSLSALEKVDDYLKEYNKAEVVTLSGDLEIEPNDVVNNNGSSKDHHKHKKTRRKTREERHEINTNGRDVSPKIFKTANKKKNSGKSARPIDLTAMLETLESKTYSEQYIDNPFSSPSPLTSPNDERLDPFGIRRPEKVYLQGGGTFQAVSRERILEDGRRDKEEEKYFRLGVLTPLDIALLVQKAWRSCAPACHGVLGGLSLMHLLLISYSDSMDASHLSFHAVVTTPYVAAYFFFCILCLISVLDRLEPTCLDLSRGLQPYFQPIVLVILYTGCLLVCSAANMYDELMRDQYILDTTNHTFNVTTLPSVPSFYYTWTHFSIWRAVLAILGLVYFVITNPQDLLYQNLTTLTQYRQTLQRIG